MQFREYLKHLEVISLQSINKALSEITVCTVSSFMELSEKIIKKT